MTRTDDRRTEGQVDAAEDSLKKQILEGEILPGAEEKMGANEKKVASGFWKTLAKAAGKVPFMEELVAAYYCAFDPKTPNRARAILLAALAYFVLPLDAVPDILAGVGFTDDITVLLAAISVVGVPIKTAHREAARQALAGDEATG